MELHLHGFHCYVKVCLSQPGTLGVKKQQEGMLLLQSGLWFKRLFPKSGQSDPIAVIALLHEMAGTRVEMLHTPHSWMTPREPV